jgi:hypothetical protein
MIRVDETGSQIALLCGGPPLFVRGTQVSCADLADGDLLEIGGFRAVYRSVQAAMVALQEAASEESKEQRLRLPESVPVSPLLRSAGDPFSELSLQLSDNLRMLGNFSSGSESLPNRLRSWQNSWNFCVWITKHSQHVGRVPEWQDLPKLLTVAETAAGYAGASRI